MGAAAQHSELVSDGIPERGRQALGRYGCGACHVISGAPGARGQVGPPLDAFGKRSMIAGRLPNTPENLIAWVQHPQSIDPGVDMPDLGVTDGDARDIAAYLLELR